MFLQHYLGAYYQGRYGGAEPLYCREMEITEAILGGDHPQYSKRLNNLALLLEMQVRVSVCRCSFGAYRCWD